MSCVIIYPMELSPVPLSDPPENMTGSHIRFLFGLASDGVYMAFSVTRETVVSYTAFPPLPEESKFPRRYLSVALSLESPPPDVIRHPALRSPDFPHLAPFGPASRDYISYFVIKRNIRQLIIISQNSLSCPSPNSQIPHSHTEQPFTHQNSFPPQTPCRIEFFGISSIGTPTK